MPWPALVFGLVAFLSTQASSYPDLEVPSLVFDYPSQDQITDDQPSPDIEQTFEVKRALTLLSRLAPIRNAFRQQSGEDRHFDARAFRPRWHTNINERAPAGPLRWGRR